MIQQEPQVRKFYRTEFKVVVLSEDNPVDDVETLQDLGHELDSGGCSGGWEVTRVTELTGPEMARALAEQGDQPELFGLDERGDLLPSDTEYAI